jgi:hypothetical protein
MVSVPYNFKSRKGKTKLLKDYEIVTQKVLFTNVVFAALISGSKYVTLSHFKGSFIFVFFPV